MSSVQTKIANLINPEVMGAYIDVKLSDAIKLSPLMDVNTELVGKAGDTLSLPKYAYVGDASDLAEGVAAETVALTSDSVDVKVKKAAKAIELTDESVLNAYGDPAGQAANQMLLSIANKIEVDAFAELRKATLSHTLTAATIGKEDIADAMVKFGEDINEEMFLFVNPTQYANLRKDADFVVIMNGEAIITGHMGSIYGANVVVSNRVGAKEAFLMKRGALGLLMKRNVVLESDRDILKRTTVLVADEHYACYLKDDSKIVKITTD